MDTTIAEMKRAAIKIIEGMRTAETRPIAVDMTMVARRAMCTTARERRPSLLKAIRTKCEGGAAEAINEKIPVPVGSAAMTGVGKREAISREVRPALAGAGAAAAVASAEEAGAGAEEGVAVAEAEEDTGKQNYPRLITTSRR